MTIGFSDVDFNVSTGVESGGGSIDNYLAGGTVITVKADGSGDYTTLESAINYISDKWSSGTVKISVSADTYVISSPITLSNQNLRLVIEGQGTSSTWLKVNYNDTLSTGFALFTITNNSNVTFKDIKVGSEKDTQPDLYNHKIFLVSELSNLVVDNVLMNGLSRCIQAEAGSKVFAKTNCSFTNARWGMFLSGAELEMNYNLTFTFTNIALCFRITQGGLIRFNTLKLSNTSVTDICNQDIETSYVSNNGLLFGTYTVL